MNFRLHANQGGGLLLATAGADHLRLARVCHLAGTEAQRFVLLLNRVVVQVKRAVHRRYLALIVPFVLPEQLNR